MYTDGFVEVFNQKEESISKDHILEIASQNINNSVKSMVMSIFANAE